MVLETEGVVLEIQASCSSSRVETADEGEAGGFRGLDGRRSKNGTVGGKVPGGVVTAGGGMGQRGS